MTASHTSVLLPCAAEFYRPSAAPLLARFVRPVATEVPPDVHIDSILAELAEGDHVAAPAGKKHDKLVAIAADAREHGIDLSIVVVQGNPARDSDLRDVATTVGQSVHGTVAVFSDDWVGTYSDSISRARLEWAEDGAKYTGGHSDDAARIFVSHLERPDTMSWPAVTTVLVVGTVVVAGALRWVKARRSAPAVAARV